MGISVRITFLRNTLQTQCKTLRKPSGDVQRISSFNKREGRPKALLCSSSPSCLRPVSVSAPSPLRPASHRPATSTGGQKDSTTTVQHVLRDTTSRGLYVRVWPPHTSERRGGGGGCEQGGWRRGPGVFGLWRVRFPPCLVRPGRRLPVQGLSEGRSRARDHPVMEIVPNKALSLSLSLSLSRAPGRDRAAAPRPTL